MRPRLVALLEPLLGGLAALIVPGYAFMLGLGALIGAALVVDRARRAGFARADSLAVLSRAYVAGLAGAGAVPLGQAALAWIEGGRFAAPTGIAAYGGLVGGAAGALVALRARRMDAARFFDAGAPAIGLGYAFARVGCFLAGCDYGAPTLGPLGTTFPPGSYAFRDQVARGLLDPAAPASLPVHPTQLYASLSGLALFALASAIPARRPGARFAWVVVAYAALRAGLETLRGDASRGHLGPLSTAQIFALATGGAALVFLARRAPPPHDGGVVDGRGGPG